MNTERLDARDRRLILFVLAVVVLSVTYARINFARAFPEASIDLRYSKDQITGMARAFLAGRGLAPEGFRNLTLFDSDETARAYLERELGLEEANRLMGGPVSVWRWRARWFRPPEKEERIVYLSPEGKLVGFRHVIAESAPGARLSQDQALDVARRFLDQRTQEPHRLIEQQRFERPNRYDYVFTWEKENFRVKSATYRRTITVQGDAAGEYREYLRVPEQWERDFAALRSRNDLFATIANAFYVPLVLAAAAILVLAIRRGAMQWQPVLLVSAAVGGLMVLNQWNALAFTIDRMPTSSPFPEMVALGLLQGMGAGVMVFFYVALAAAAGEPLYRTEFPNKLSLRGAFSKEGIRTKEFFLATVSGYGFAGFHTAFIVAFYIIAQRLGAWSPQDVQYSDLLSTWLPWLYPLTIALMASTSEEFWFRLFGISLFKRYLKLRWLAVIIPAFIWGFLHANYPQQPAWIRGVEVGVIGVGAGFLMLRFGILATLVWHYTIDAILIGMFLLQSKSLYFQLSGWFVGGAVLLPLLASVVFYFRNGGFLVDDELKNAASRTLEAEPEPAPQIQTEAAAGEEAFTPAWPARSLYLAAVVALLLGLFANPVRMGDFVKVRLTRTEAQAVSDAWMRGRGVEPAQWRAVSEFIANVRAPDFEYLRRLYGREQANRIIEKWTQTAVWRTNYFRPLQKEEWYVYVDVQKRVFRTDHALAETAPGANLGQDDARRLAEHYLARQEINLGTYRLVDAQTEKREKRTDHGFVWESTEFRAGEATARVSVRVIGDEVSEFRRFLKLPEQWVRDFERPRIQSFFFPAALGVLVVPLLVVFIRRLSGHGTPAHRYHWRAYLTVALVAAALSVVAVVNQWPSLWSGYSTETPVENFLAGLVAYRLILVLLIAGGVFAGVLALDVFLQGATGGWIPPPLDVFHAAAAAVLIWGAGRSLAWLEQLVSGPRYGQASWLLPGVDALVPAYTVLHDAFTSGTLRTIVLVVAVSAAFGFLSRRTRLVLVGILLAALAAGAASIGLAAFSLFTGLLWIAIVLFLLKTCGPAPLTFAVAFFWLTAASESGALISQPNVWYRVNGAAALAASAAIGVWLLRRFVVKADRSPSIQA